MTFDIQFFGAIEIRHNGTLLTGFRSQKALVLLAYLLCEERALTREYLAGFGWPESEQSQALGLLRRSLHDLNRQLSGCLDLDRQTVRFQPDAPITVDTQQFRTLSAQSDVASWSAAAALYRAPFLQGSYVDDAPELESWLLREQEQWQGEMVRLLLRLADHYADNGDYAQALRHTQRLLALEPWCEEAHRQAMLLLARMGQTSAALAQYESCRRILQAELAVEPSHETKTLRARLAAIAQLPTPSLPASTTPFIGRTTQLAELTQLLANHDCRLITLLGQGGMGKTRLALETARDVATAQQRRFLHGVCFVPLVGVATLPQLVAALGHALALPFQPHSTPESQLLHYLQDKELLLVLDNFEQLVNEPVAAFVRQLLDRAPALKLLITSRVRLHLQGEQLYGMQGLAVPITATQSATPSVAEVATYSSVQLFLATVQRSQQSYSLSAADAAAVTTICQLVQGMPLALELAAAWINVLTVAEIAIELARNLDFLASDAHDLPLRQRSMRAVFETSWCLLTAAEQRVFQQLSVFRGGFTGEAAETVAGASLSLLMGLMHKAFLYRASDKRFEVHELLRQFAQEQLWHNQELHQTQQRHTGYFVALAEEAERHFASARLGQWIERLEDEYDNLQAALTWALETKAIAQLLRLACSLHRFWDCRGHYIDMNYWLEQGLLLAEQAWVHRSNSAGETDEASSADNLALLAQAFFSRANALMHDRESAEVLYNRSLRLDQRIGPTPLSIDICQALTWIERRRGNFARADELQQVMLHLAETLPDFQGEQRQQKIAYAIAVDSVNALYQADLARSATLAMQSFSLLDAVEDERLRIHMVFVLGQIAFRENDFERAKQLLTDCYRQLSEAGDSDGVVILQCHLSLLTLRQGDWPSAKAAFLENLTWLQHHNKDLDGLLYNLRGLAEATRQQGNLICAAKLLGAIEKIGQLLKCTIPPIYQPDFEETLTATRAELDSVDFAAAYHQGYMMTLEQAVAFALGND